MDDTHAVLSLVQTFSRPHPNECSGSDLDGDIYFVSWDPELIPARMAEPMEYAPAPTMALDHDVTIEVLTSLLTWMLFCKPSGGYS